MMQAQASMLPYYSSICRSLWCAAPNGGYFPDPTKIILVASEINLTQSETYIWGMGIKLVTRSRYIGGLICYQEEETKWLSENVQVSNSLVETMVGVARQHPKDSIYWSETPPPTRVGFFIAHHPWGRWGLFPSWGSAQTLLPTGSLLQFNVKWPSKSYHLPIG